LTRRPRFGRVDRVVSPLQEEQEVVVGDERRIRDRRGRDGLDRTESGTTQQPAELYEFGFAVDTTANPAFENWCRITSPFCATLLAKLAGSAA